MWHIVKKEDFKAALRALLRRVPLDARKRWSDVDLFVWWLEVRREDPNLVWEGRKSEDAWQWIPEMCRDLIGAEAI